MRALWSLEPIYSVRHSQNIEKTRGEIVSPSRIIEDCLVTFGIIKNFSGLSKLYGPSGKYPDYPETFQTIRKLFRPSVNFPDHLKTLKTIWSRNFPIQFQGLHTKTFWACKNFLGGNDTMVWASDPIQGSKEIGSGTAQSHLPFQRLMLFILLFFCPFIN